MKTLLSSLEMMKGELTARMSSAAEIFTFLSENAEYPAKKLYENACVEIRNADGDMLSLLWRRAVEKTPELCLTDTEKLSLYDVGICLGRYDVNSADKMLTRIITRLEQYRVRAEEDKRREVKLQAYLSVIGGIFVVIILL